MTSTITGVFKSRMRAEEAFEQLERAGVTSDQISLVMTDEARGKHFDIKESSKVDEGTAAGAGIGGLIGAIAGIVASAGVIVIPGLNLVVAGAIVSSLAGLGAGGLVGGLVGFLVGAGIPEHEAKFYEEEVAKGNVLVAVRAETKEQEERTKQILRDNDATSIAA